MAVYALSWSCLAFVRRHLQRNTEKWLVVVSPWMSNTPLDRFAPALGFRAALTLVFATSCSVPPPRGADGGDAATDVAMDTAPVAPVARWVVPRSGPNGFLLPWPSDLALSASGHIDLRYVPNDVNNGLVRDYQTALDGRIAGFSTVGATYFRFSVPIDTSTLPASPSAFLDASASVQIVDIDPASPERGRRHPGQYHFQLRGTRYWPPNTLAIAPAFGFPLRARTRYAVVVTSRVRAADGATINRDNDLAALMSSTSGDDALARARAVYEPALAELERTGIARADVLSLAVFTTQDPTSEMFRVVDAAASFEAPHVIDMVRAGDQPRFRVYTGHYGPNPVFQAGTPPYETLGSGDFVFDSSGVPQVQRRETITFALTVPTTEMPPGGYPIVIYAHGTGGDARSFIADGTAASLAARGIAVFGFDQVFNGDRTVGGGAMGSAESQFFNFLNPIGGRRNNQQATVDLVQAGRLVRTLTVPTSVSGLSAEIRFDGAHTMFFGHSQGGLNGPLWLASEDGAGAAVLSGAGGTLSLALSQKTEPINVPLVLATALGIPTSTAATELVPLHPIITLAQTAVDIADPVNYARFIIREPRPGRHAKHVFQTLGLIDHYTPPDAIASLAIAQGLQLANPVLRAYGTYDLLALPAADLPLRANLAGGMVTGVWQQFNSAAGRDGHFVVFTVTAARNRAAEFLASYLSDRQNIPTLAP